MTDQRGMWLLARVVMRGFLVGTIVFALVVVVPLRASSHPSDFETLTIDLLFGPGGLHAIDAAVVESSGPSYRPGPSVELREMVAQEVLDALGLTASPVDIDVENSERYHWVGFTIRFLDPSLGGRSTLEIDSGPLQAIAADVGLKRLKLTLFGVTPPEGVGQVWILTPDDEPVSTAVPLQDELPTTGFDILHLVTWAFVLVVTGLILVTTPRRQNSQSRARALQ